MKVSLEKDYRKYYTLEELDQAKAVIAWEKLNDEETAAGWAEYAAREALKDSTEYPMEVIQASARTAKNRRAWNAFGEETGQMDVWIKCLARTTKGFIEVGAYLTDIWQTGAEPYKHHEYIREYRAVD